MFEIFPENFLREKIFKTVLRYGKKNFRKDV